MQTLVTRDETQGVALQAYEPTRQDCQAVPLSSGRCHQGDMLKTREANNHPSGDSFWASSFIRS